MKTRSDWRAMTSRLSRRAWLVLALAGTLVLGSLGVAVANSDLFSSEPTSADAATSPAGETVGPETPTPLPTDTPTATAAVTDAPTPSPDAAAEAITYEETSGSGGGGRNIVIVTNRRDGALTVRGAIQFNRIPGPNVEPVNLARALSSCVDCRTLAVALQVNLIERGASRVAPQNAAVALNFECTRCVTVARALQYTFTVDDVTAVPRDVDALIREMEAELRAVARDRNMTLSRAIQRINAVLADFSELAESLDDRQARATDTTSPGASPLPSESPAASAEPQSSPTPTDQPAATPSPAATDAPSPTPDASPSEPATP